ncbi:MAG: ATP-binding protein [Balneolales bacterium]
MKRTLESFESLSEQKNITLVAELPDQPIRQLIDRDKFEKVILNLLSNALKFTPKGGTVTLDMACEADSCRIAIRDTGRGIPAEQLSSIFDRFYSTKEIVAEEGQGLGIGLALAKQFAGLHEGSLSVESLPGKGSTFTFSFPRESEKVKNAPRAVTAQDAGIEADMPEDVKPFPVSVAGISESAPLVLVVEDNNDMRHYISDLLAQAGIRTETATNGLDGKKKLAFVKPDMVISDIMMPEMDGFEFARVVRSQFEFRFIPLLLLSARAEVEDRIQGFEIGVSDYLVKPFHDGELLVRVKNLLKFKTSRDEELAGFKPGEAVGNEEADMVNRLRTFVEERIRESEINVEDLSQEVYLSRRQLYRNLKAATGFTPAEFVREIKLSRARRLLENRQVKTVSQAMYATGYASRSYFTKMFKARYGKSPGEYLD